MLISYKIPHISSGWHDKTHDSRVYITNKMISVDKNVKEGFKWFGWGERKLDFTPYLDSKKRLSTIKSVSSILFQKSVLNLPTWNGD